LSHCFNSFNNLQGTLPDTLMLRVAYDFQANGRFVRIADTGEATDLAGPRFPVQFPGIAELTNREVRINVHFHKLHQWRNYECWLGPLKKALGDARVRYREFEETDSRGL